MIGVLDAPNSIQRSELLKEQHIVSCKCRPSHSRLEHDFNGRPGRHAWLSLIL